MPLLLAQAERLPVEGLQFEIRCKKARLRREDSPLGRFGGRKSGQGDPAGRNGEHSQAEGRPMVYKKPAHLCLLINPRQEAYPCQANRRQGLNNEEYRICWEMNGDAV